MQDGKVRLHTVTYDKRVISLFLFLSTESVQEDFKNISFFFHYYVLIPARAIEICTGTCILKKQVQ